MLLIFASRWRPMLKFDIYFFSRKIHSQRIFFINKNSNNMQYAQLERVRYVYMKNGMCSDKVF